jgi:hypothetical protein
VENVSRTSGVFSTDPLTDHCDRIFYVDIGVSALVFVLLAAFLRLDDTRAHLIHRLGQVDWTGLLILSGSMTGLIFAVISGGSVYPWSSVHVLAPLTIGCTGVLLFSLFEALLAGRHGFGPAFAPMRLFANRTAAAGYLLTLVHAMVLWAIPYYFLLYVSGWLDLPGKLATYTMVASHHRFKVTCRSQRSLPP